MKIDVESYLLKSVHYVNDEAYPEARGETNLAIPRRSLKKAKHYDNNAFAAPPKQEDFTATL